MDALALWAAIALAILWIGIGGALAVSGARRLQSARSIVSAARSLQNLLELSPGRPLVVRSDGTIEADSRLLREIGIEGSPKSLSGPQRQRSRAGGRRRRCARRPGAQGGDFRRPGAGTGAVSQDRAGSSMSVGAPAPAPEPAGTMVLWFFDASAAETERSKLSQRLTQAESALDSLTRLIEAAPFPMWYRGPDLNLGLVNSAFVEAVEGHDAAEVIARSSELVGDTDEAKRAAFEAVEGGKPISRKRPAIIHGERRMLQIVDVPLPTGAVAGFALDLQDLEDARAELSRQVQSQYDLVNRMTAGAAQFDSDRYLSFFNRPFASMARIEPEWLDETPEFDRVLERMRENDRVPETRDFPTWKAERRDWFTSPNEVVEEDWMLPGGDHWRVVGQPLPDGGLRLFLEDRTEQVRLASARDTLLRVRSATFDNLFEAIGVFASDGRLYLWNSRFSQVWDLDDDWLAEHPRVDEMVPAMARKLVNPAAAAQIREMVRKTTTDRQPANGRITLTDGRHFEFAAVPLPDGNALFTLVDVTDSTRIEAALRERATALEEADRVKTDFVANMSYELRTPLTSIGGFTEMLAQGYAGTLTPAASDYVQAILESVERLSKLIDDVLDLTQGNVGVALERERVDIAGLCKTAVTKLESRIDEKGQKLRTEISESAGIVVGDARRLRESIEHVIDNAIAYTDRGGKIAVKAWGDDDEAVVQVSDNGAGIAKKDLPRVFNRFDRVTHEPSRGEAALGLGLPLTRQFVEAHGGKVDLVSAKGKGTTVTLTIPRAPK
jgi:signal transduction histidine kinase